MAKETLNKSVRGEHSPFAPFDTPCCARHSGRTGNVSNRRLGLILRSPKFSLLIPFVAGLALSLPAAAKLYKWVDDKGVTHYSETIPPEYANKDRSELSKSGRVVKKEILTPEQRRAKEEAEAGKRAEEEAAREQKRHDKALINTYSSVEEIDLARERTIQQVQSRLNSISSQINRATDELRALKAEAVSNTSAGRAVPPSLKEDMEEAQARLTKLQQELEQVKTEKSSIEARYEADKARYKELTGK